MTEESPIVQLVQEYEEEASQSTVTLLPSDEQEEELPWFELETQSYCSELLTVCCISSFPEYVHKRCSAIAAIHRHCLEKDGTWERSYLSWQSQLGSTRSLPSLMYEQPPEKLDTLIAEPSKTIVDVLSSALSEDTVNQTESTFELEPSHPQTVSQSVFMDVTSSKLQSIMEVSSEPTKHETVSETPEVPFQEEIPAEEVEGFVGSVTEKQSSASVVTEFKVVTTEEPLSTEVISKPTEMVPQAECIVATESYNGEAKISSSEMEKAVVSPVAESSSLEIKDDEQSVEETFLAIPVSGGLSRTATDFYAELQNATELGYANGNLVHGSNQKESVFMRLNNRIKALELNTSLSSRYLEELSQR